MTIGEKLRKARGEKKRKDVADAIGTSVSALGMYENDFRIPRDEVKIRLAAFYGTSVQDLFFNA